MRILLLNDRIDPTGGSQLLTRGISDGLAARGHETRILASDAGLDPADRPANASLCRGSLEGSKQTLLRTWNPSAAAALRREIASFRPDVVHVRAFLTQLSPSILPELAGVPALYHAVHHAAVCPTAKKLLPDGRICTFPAGSACKAHCLSVPAFAALMTQRALFRRSWHRFDAVLANSRCTADHLVRDGLGRGPGADEVRVVYNAVPATPARPPLSDPPRAVFVGRLSREKGVATLLHAWARVREEVPAAVLDLVGTGPLEAELEALAAATLGADAAVFHGRLPRPEAEAVATPAWVQAVPSTWDEPFGLVAAEAMMRGTAVVVPGHGGLAEVPEAGVSGLLAPAGDPEAWADALLTLLARRSRAEAMGRAARERATSRFTMDRLLDETEEVYNSIRRTEAAHRHA
ncbi:glycosyltransferase family 4 protein [Phycisphaera mikurensis]|uniref:Putative glycosyltransferase n=1 Tax=Phycisphaera mikurensis (strain NBRC 102666 / KCTC 22515 / FYK2301M01) TaxID=1142394 RepID=I0IFU2_PHYMF|nr:glycosyltransferase family 4 protein [Phycisphaera mikurensis]MBB6440481.1 glycosyltransferase involved in cell wall biosynthesis [Phycisphaera mikurensis]BAM04130.1 putative glycosyltransferase [Phycisphaera mikurensis NBRC 102666]